MASTTHETPQPDREQARRTRGHEQILADTAICVRFFSRIHLPRLSSRDDPSAPPDFTQVSYAAPLAGLVVAAPACLLLLILSLTHLPALASAALVTGLLAVVTGALHEDGLGDVADGFFGGHTRERRLEIMKDSRVGAFGALTLAGAFLLKAALIGGLISHLGAWSALVLLMCEGLARALMIQEWHKLPSARPEGLGNRFGKPDSDQVRKALVIGVLLLLPLLFCLPFVNIVLAALLAWIVSAMASHLAMAKIGGITGDVLGAIQQLSALAFLIGLQLLAI